MDRHPASSVYTSTQAWRKKVLYSGLYEYPEIYRAGIFTARHRAMVKNASCLHTPFPSFSVPIALKLLYEWSNPVFFQTQPAMDCAASQVFVAVFVISLAMAIISGASASTQEWLSKYLLNS